MKKFIFFLVVFLTMILVKTEVKAKEVTLNWIPNVYYNYKKDGLIYWGQMAYIKVSGNIAYCYEIQNTITTSTYDYTTTGLTLYKDTGIIPYFGYGYNSNTTSLNYYLATQEMIWEEFNYEVYFTTEGEGKGNIINVDNEKNVISNYVDNYKRVPTFDNTFKFELGSTNTITDTSNVLNNFTLINNSSNIINKEENNLTITANVGGEYTFSLLREYNRRFSNVKYYAANSQTIIQIGNLNRSIYNYSYNVSYGNAIINLIDKYTNSNTNSGLSTFSNNTFEIYNSNGELINKYKTDETGIIKINNLNIGKYIIKHLLISDGYKKERDTYEFEIKNDTNEIINIILEPITTTLNIKKTYGNPILNTKYYDDAVTFLIKDINNNVIKEIITNELGECNTILNYNEYIITQKNINHINEISEEYKITLNDFSNNINYNIFTPLYNSKIKVTLYEKDTTIPIKNAIFKINNKNYVTDEYGMFTTEYYDIGNYILIQEDIPLYIKSDNKEIIIDEFTNTYLDNNEVITNIILYNEKIIIEEEKNIEEIKNDKDEIIINENKEETKELILDEETIIINDSNKTPNLDPIKENIIIDEYNDIVSNTNNNVNLEKDLEKLPNLGISISYVYMIIIFFGFKNDKKNNS